MTVDLNDIFNKFKEYLNRENYDMALQTLEVLRDIVIDMKHSPIED